MKICKASSKAVLYVRKTKKNTEQFLSMLNIDEDVFCRSCTGILEFQLSRSTNCTGPCLNPSR